jgi:predicted nucleotidyltransferase
MGHRRGFNEGDYLKTKEDLFFAVKGNMHPENLVVAILRYIPHPNGDRILSGVRYKRLYDTGSTSEYLLKKYPEYVNHIPQLGIELQSVPITKIAHYYEPRERLIEILKNPDSEVERIIVDFVNVLSASSGVSTDSFGVSGSVLIGLQTGGSDIDINVYGQVNGRKTYDALADIRENQEWVKPLKGVLFNSVLSSRWGDTGVPLDKFSGIESSKVLHGVVHGREYFVRLLMADDGSVSKPIKHATIKARIFDASRSIYNPCIYRVTQISGDTENIMVSELKSYRGKFTEQAQEGDMVEARGILEEVHGEDAIYHRLILGGSGDYLLPLKLKE